MKANRKFVEGEEAVSAVIGVILMVAITVAIAATVYVYVSGMMGGAAEKAPTITFTKDEALNTLTVVQADVGISWSDINMTATDGTDTNYTHGQTGDVTAGDTIDLDGRSLDAGDVTVRFSYTPTNALIGTYKLTSVTA
jgi:flagellin-like protein